MNNIETITVRRLEGRTKECFATTHKTVESAESRLWSIAETAPDNGAYDKTSVIITFKNGDTIETRHDVKRYGIDGGIITHAKQILQTLKEVIP